MCCKCGLVGSHKHPLRAARHRHDGMRNADVWTAASARLHITTQQATHHVTVSLWQCRQVMRQHNV